MSGRSKEAHSFKVFPFLAVLICTMGSLIFLLLVTSLKIRQREAAFAASERAYRNLAIAEAEKSEELSEPIATPDPEPEPSKVVTRSAPKPVFRPVEPVDDGYEVALAERKRELSELKTKARTRAEKLASEREQRLRVLALRRQQVQATLEKTDNLQFEIQQLENHLGEIAGEAATANDPNDDAERVLVEQQILQMKRRLRAAQVADATAQNDQFQVVPFDPQTGTTRRPIFIECSAAGIRFLPEDILITAKDLEGFTPKANPIAAGTGALINYWSARNLKQQDPRSEPEPYVLILVRPEGVVAYYVALRMLEPVRTAQGYELIEDSTVLKLPDVDGGAKTACQSAVNRLMSERDKIARSALASGSAASVFGGAPGRRGSGGGRPGGGGSSGGSGGGGTGGGGQAFGGGNGSNSAGTNDLLQSGGNSFTMNDLTGGDHDVGSRSWERVENFQGRPRGKTRGDEAAGGFGNQAGGSGGNTGGTFGGNRPGIRPGLNPGDDDGLSVGSEGGAGDGNSRGSYAGGTGGTGSGPAWVEGDATDDGIGYGPEGSTTGGTGGGRGRGPGGSPGGGLAGGPSGGGSNGVTAGGVSGQGSATSQDGNSRMSQGNGNRSSGGRNPGNSNGTSFTGSVSGGVASGQSSEGWDEPEPGMPIGQRPNRKSAKSKSGGDGESNGPGGDSDGDGNFAQGDGSSSSRPGGQSGSSSLSDNGSSSPRFSHTKGSSTRAPHPGERPNKRNNDVDKPLEPEMLAGRRWGFCEPGASIGFEREVRVDVSENKLLIAEKYAIPVGQGESRQETLELFATALDNYSHEWGRPPQGFFWAPRLKFIVKPEGNGHYEQVNAMMTRAGLATSHEFSKQNETIEFGRDTASATKPAKKPAPKTAASTKAGANR